MNLALLYVDDGNAFVPIPALCRQLRLKRPAFLLGNDRHQDHERIDGTEREKNYFQVSSF